MKPQNLETKDAEDRIESPATPDKAQRSAGTMRTRFNGQKNVVQQVQKMAEETKKEATPPRMSQRGAVRRTGKRDGTDKQIAGRKPKQARKVELQGESDDSSELVGDDEGDEEKTVAQNQFSDVIKAYRRMFEFDWGLRELCNMRHSPEKASKLEEDFTAGAFWFFINTTFFNHELQDVVLDQSADEWTKSLHDKLACFKVAYMDQCMSEVPKGEDESPAKTSKVHRLTYVDQTKKDNKDAEMTQPDRGEDADQIVQQKRLLVTDSQKQFLEKDLPLDQIKALFHVDKLVSKRGRFSRFRHYLRCLVLRLSTDEAKQMFDDEALMGTVREQAELVPREPEFSEGGVKQASPAPRQDEAAASNPPDQKDAERTTIDPDTEIAALQRKIDVMNFQKMMAIAERDLENLQAKNRDSLKGLFGKVKGKYKAALDVPADSEEYRDSRCYVPQLMAQYGDDFLAYIEPAFAQDMAQNREWYGEHLSKFLLNINYPSKLQYEFLKELELAQQRRNDKRYQKILEQMKQIERRMETQDGQATDENRQWFDDQLKQFHQKQSILVQDDACCAICNNGDYDEDNEIVFCAHCSIPVHQQCFGLDAVPENDFICNNCFAFGFQRGLMVKCLLCPKRGGAMKPTNIFRSQEKYYNQKIKVQIKKSVKHRQDFPTPEELADRPQIDNLGKHDWQAFKSLALGQLENNGCLTELMKREFEYKCKVYYDEEDEAGRVIEATDAKTLALRAQKSAQEEIQLNYTKNELKNHCIPDDYKDFITRNDAILTAPDTPVTDSLYYWVHHSCSMWTPGPQVTPKTPVKMNKLDFEKFTVGCVICGRKGIDVGATVKCYKGDCDIQFHVECAKRANYCMEIERKAQGATSRTKERIFKIFCESHRPFKIIQEIKDQQKRAIEDIHKFARTIGRCYHVFKRAQLKPRKQMTKMDRTKIIRQALLQRKAELMSEKKAQKLGRPKKIQPKAKKWKERDKRQLLERVKEKYLAIRKMRFNLIKIDPMLNEERRYQREIKRLAKAKEKRRKHENQLQLDLYHRQQQMENLTKRRERGLRGRLDGLTPDEGEAKDADDVEAIQRSIEELSNAITALQKEDMEEQEVPTLQKLSEYYKFASPPQIQELEWKVTLSRYDFPWQDIAFEPFTAKECYKMYQSLVTDVHSFLKRVLGDKVKYQKMIRNQMRGLPPIDMMMNMPAPPQAAQLEIAPENIEALVSLEPAQQDSIPGQAYQSGQNMVVFNPKAYCRCKGAILSDIMVACESGEEACINGGWLHPQCTRDLREFTKEQIDNIDIWYCEDCVAQNKGSNNMPGVESPKKKSPSPIGPGMRNESGSSQKMVVRLNKSESPRPKTDKMMRQHQVTPSGPSGTKSIRLETNESLHAPSAVKHQRPNIDQMGPSMPEDEEEALMRELLHLLESQPEKVEQAVLRDPQLHKYLTHQLNHLSEKEVSKPDEKHNSHQQMKQDEQALRNLQAVQQLLPNVGGDPKQTELITSVLVDSLVSLQQQQEPTVPVQQSQPRHSQGSFGHQSSTRRLNLFSRRNDEPQQVPTHQPMSQTSGLDQIDLMRLFGTPPPPPPQQETQQPTHQSKLPFKTTHKPLFQTSKHESRAAPMDLGNYGFSNPQAPRRDTRVDPLKAQPGPLPMKRSNPSYRGPAEQPMSQGSQVKIPDIFGMGPKRQRKPDQVQQQRRQQSNVIPQNPPVPQQQLQQRTTEDELQLSDEQLKILAPLLSQLTNTNNP